MLDSAMRICGAKFGHLLLYDGESYHAAHLQNLPQFYCEIWERGPIPAKPEPCSWSADGRCERSSGQQQGCSDRNPCCSCHAVTPSRFISARLTERLADGAVPVRLVMSVGVRRGIDYGIPALRPRQKPTPVNPTRLAGRACFPTASVSIDSRAQRARLSQ